MKGTVRVRLSRSVTATVALRSTVWISKFNGSPPGGGLIWAPTNHWSAVRRRYPTLNCHAWRFRYWNDSPCPPKLGVEKRIGSQPCANDCLGRSEEHTSELQSRLHLVCRLLLEKKK